MAPAFEGGCQKRVHHRERGGFIDELATETEHVCIIVHAGRHGFLDGADIRRAHMAVAVRGDAHAHAGGAGEDAEIIGAVRDIAGDGVGIIRIIHGLAGEWTEVVNIVAAAFQMREDGVFHFKGAVIGSEGNAEGGMAHGRGGIQDGETRIGNRKFRHPREMSAATPQDLLFQVVPPRFRS